MSSRVTNGLRMPARSAPIPLLEMQSLEALVPDVAAKIRADEAATLQFEADSGLPRELHSTALNIAIAADGDVDLAHDIAQALARVDWSIIVRERDRRTVSELQRRADLPWRCDGECGETFRQGALGPATVCERPFPEPYAKLCTACRASVEQRCTHTCRRCGVKYQSRTGLSPICGRCRAVRVTAGRRPETLLNARAATTRLTLAQWWATLERFGFKCAYCGVGQFESHDHLTPRSLGGITEPHNLAPACFSCNSSKGVSTRPLVGGRSADEVREILREIHPITDTKGFTP